MGDHSHRKSGDDATNGYYNDGVAGSIHRRVSRTSSVVEPFDIASKVWKWVG